MNKQEAKEWLSAFTDGSEAEMDPRMQKALQLAETDPELRAWWERQRVLDPQLRRALQQSPIPKGLEAALMETVGQPGNRFGTNARSRWRWLIGMAAMVILSLSTVFYLRHNESLVQSIQMSLSGTNQDSFDHFRDGMAYYVRDIYFQLDHLTEDLNSIESWLAKTNSPVNESLPDKLLTLVPLGCKQLYWQEQKVSLLCFHTPDQKIVHLFILDRQGIEANRYDAIENIAVSHNLETGGWVTDTHVYLLVGSDPEVDIEFALG